MTNLIVLFSKNGDCAFAGASPPRTNIKTITIRYHISFSRLFVFGSVYLRFTSISGGTVILLRTPSTQSTSSGTMAEQPRTR
jgi:hypothetical protein